MALPANTRLGPYEIIAPAGAGGMGEVYRARDPRLDRTVAIKILPSYLSERPESKQRFEREARAISSLQHPNICTLYDIGSQDGTDYLVMEYLEGETLAERLVKGPLPAEQVLSYGVQVAEGLEKAHRSGVVPRDLKPGNIMLTKSGAKLMDFGLGKTTLAAPPASGLTATLTSPHPSQPLAAEGMIVGTFQYMSPEQVEGREADARSDIFAWGAVLYEMATGKRAFSGKSQASIVASILASEPKPISVVQPMSPPALDRVVKGCLAKDPDERWQTAHDVKLQLEWIAEGGSQAGIPAPLAARRKVSQNVAWGVAAVCLLAALTLTAAFLLRAPKPALPLRASLLPPKNYNFDAYSFAISPDGKKLVFAAVTSGKSNSTLWVRPLDSVAAQELAGTENAQYPLWSPDSTAIGFFVDGKLKKIDAAGGPVISVADAEDGRGGSWSRDGTIVFSRKPSGEGFYQVSSAGGPVSEVTHFNKQRNEDSHRWPWLLPDGRHFVFYMSSTLTQSGSNEKDQVAGICLYDRKAGNQTYLLHTDTGAQYANEYLFYLRQENLMAQPFDPSWARFLETRFRWRKRCSTTRTAGSAPSPPAPAACWHTSSARGHRVSLSGTGATEKSRAEQEAPAGLTCPLFLLMGREWPRRWQGRTGPTATSGFMNWRGEPRPG